MKLSKLMIAKNQSVKRAKKNITLHLNDMREFYYQDKILHSLG